MRPVLFSIGILEFHAYTVFMALALLVGTMLVVRENYKREDPYPITPAGGLWVFIGGLLGAKIYWTLQYGDITALHQVVLFWQGGLVFFGGLIGGFLGGMLYLKLQRVPIIPMADIALPFLPLAHGIARFGCFFNGCCHGRPSEMPWAVVYPRPSGPFSTQLGQGLIDAGATAPLAVHPTPVYESLGLFLIFGIMYWAYRRPHHLGAVALLYPILYGMLRFGVEAFRGESTRSVLSLLTVSQTFALSLTLGGALLYTLCWLTVWRGRPMSPDPAPDEEETHEAV